MSLYGQLAVREAKTLNPEKLMDTTKNKNAWMIEGSSKARLVSVTPDAEATMAYVARVSSKDQENPDFKRLLKYCIKHGHWSVMEQAYMTVEVITPLAIAVQLLRHRSFTMQQYSGRYEDQSFMREYTEDLPAFMEMFYIPEEARLQDTKNRQNSIIAEDGALTDFMWGEFEFAYKACAQSYLNMLNKGIAKEIARFVLPEGVYTRLYVTGSCRSWIHYLSVRDDEGVAQHEHCELARCVKPVFANVFPTVYDSVDWKKQPTVIIESTLKELEEAKKQISTLKSLLAPTQLFNPEK
jgi:thymidylate synthase (FAD)